MNKIVVITHESDAHIPFVEPHLSSELVVIDPFQIFKDQELSYIFDGKKGTTSYKNKKITNVKSVWYRKPMLRDPKRVKIQSEFEEYSESATTNHIQMLRSQFADAYWVSDFYAINRARNKAWQMDVASRLGFSVPKTLITSDKIQAQKFLSQHSPAIIKSLATAFPAINNKTHFFFAKRIDDDRSVNLNNLHLAPAIFQQAINAIADVRVTVVGDKIFCAIITSKNEKDKGTVRDWRLQHAFYGTTFSSYDKETPQKIKDQCISLVKEMSLEYGAIDFVIDKAGKFWFLEINPNGQWAFVEEETGQPIGKALAQLLESGKRHS